MAEDIKKTEERAKKTFGAEENPCEACPHASGGHVGGYDVISNTKELKMYLAEMFSDEYMKEYTNFDNFEAFKYSSAVINNWEADPMIYNKANLDGFVRESTQFQSWDEMVKHAADLRYKSDK